MECEISNVFFNNIKKKKKMKIKKKERTNHVI